MTIRSTAALETLRREAVAAPCETSQDKRAARKTARKFASLLGRLEQPRYEREGGWSDDETDPDPDKVVLVFVNEPPVELGTPAFESRPADALLLPRTESTPMGLPMMPDPDNGGRLSPILNEEDCALAAYRRLLLEAHEYGPVLTWHVTTLNEATGAWERRAYKGTESALRRNFPDGHEATRMDAAGMLGVPNWVAAPGQHYPAPVLTADDYDGPAVPYRIRRHTT